LALAAAEAAGRAQVAAAVLVGAEDEAPAVVAAAVPVVVPAEAVEAAEPKHKASMPATVFS
jgi:hypothetical protein